jgi:hypothetical protein
MTNHVLVGPTQNLKKRDLGQHSGPVLVVRPLSLACIDDDDSADPRGKDTRQNEAVLRFILVLQCANTAP